MPSPPSRFRSPRPSLVGDSMLTEDVSSWWAPQQGAICKFKDLLESRQFICANLLITMAAVIKGSVEEMLPFHGDHQWGYDPLAIGQLFCTIAVAYMVAAAIVCQTWARIGRLQIGCSSAWLAMYGISAWLAWSVAYYYKETMVLSVTLAVYGFCCGLTFTAASQLIADVIDHEEGSFKEAANGIWNATWEAGGSLGFFLGGLLAEHYEGQLALLARYLVCSIITALCMIAVAFWPEAEPIAEAKSMKCFAARKDAKALDYGTA